MDEYSFWGWIGYLIADYGDNISDNKNNNT